MAWTHELSVRGDDATRRLCSVHLNNAGTLVFSRCVFWGSSLHARDGERTRLKHQATVKSLAASSQHVHSHLACGDHMEALAWSTYACLLLVAPLRQVGICHSGYLGAVGTKAAACHLWESRGQRWDGSLRGSATGAACHPSTDGFV